jgi:hypothetical protein
MGSPDQFILYLKGEIPPLELAVNRIITTAALLQAKMLEIPLRSVL